MQEREIRICAGAFGTRSEDPWKDVCIFASFEGLSFMQQFDLRRRDHRTNAPCGLRAERNARRA